jgi:hypothetical protein
MLLEEARPTSDFIPLAKQMGLHHNVHTSKRETQSESDIHFINHHVFSQVVQSNGQRPIPQIVDVTPNTGDPNQLQVVLATSKGEAFYMRYKVYISPFSFSFFLSLIHSFCFVNE